jgi:3-hydroxyacyl-CoA dehydrogenase
LAMRASDLFRKNDVELNVYKNISWLLLAKVSTSAYEAFDTGLLQHGKDIVVVIKTVKLPKLRNMFMAEVIIKRMWKVLGKQALGMFLVGTNQMVAGKYISEHDQKLQTNWRM